MTAAVVLIQPSSLILFPFFNEKDQSRLKVSQLLKVEKLQKNTYRNRNSASYQGVSSNICAVVKVRGWTRDTPVTSIPKRSRKIKEKLDSNSALFMKGESFHFWPFSCCFAGRSQPLLGRQQRVQVCFTTSVCDRDGPKGKCVKLKKRRASDGVRDLDWWRAWRGF